MLKKLVRLYHNIGLNIYDAAWSRIILLCVISFVLFLISVLANRFGLPQFGAFIGCIFIIASLLAVSYPKLVDYVLLAGAATKPKKPLDGIKQSFGLLGKTFSYVLMWVSFLFMLTATLPIGRNLWAIPLIFLASATFILATIVYEIETKWLKRTIVAYSVITIFVTIGSLIPGPTYVAAISFDPYLCRVSETDRLVYEIRNVLDEKQDKAMAKKLEAIKADIETGKEIAPENLKLIEESRKERDSGTLPRRLGEMFSRSKKLQTKEYTPRNELYSWPLEKGQRATDHFVRPMGKYYILSDNHQFELIDREGRRFTAKNFPSNIREFMIEATEKTSVSLLVGEMPDIGK